jgi:hypothetical protein
MDETRAPRRAGAATFRERVRVVRVTMPAAKRDPAARRRVAPCQSTEKEGGDGTIRVVTCRRCWESGEDPLHAEHESHGTHERAPADIHDGKVDVGALSKALGIDDGAEEDSDD